MEANAAGPADPHTAKPIDWTEVQRDLGPDEVPTHRTSDDLASQASRLKGATDVIPRCNQASNL